MKKYLTTYIGVFAVLLVVFSLVAFICTAEADAFGGVFWLSYGLVVLTFVLNLSFAWAGMQANSAKEMFNSMAYLRTCGASLTMTIVVSSVCMVVPQLPLWICAVVCVLTVGLNTISFLKAKGAAEIVEAVDKKVASTTAFIKLLTADAKTLADTAKGEENQALTKKVYEAIRYSDPVCDPAVAGIDSQIRASFDIFAKTVQAEQNADIAAENLLYLLKQRNAYNKAVK